MRCSSKSKNRLAYLSLLVVLVAVIGSRANAEFVFGEPVNLGWGINTLYSDGLACIASNGLSLYFISNRPGGSGNHDLYVATRTSNEDKWSQPINLGSNVNSSAEEFFSCVSSDEFTLYFDSTRSGGRGRRDLWGTTRSSVDAPWARPVNLGSPINGGSDDVSPNLSADGLTLLFASDRSGGRGSYDLYICTRYSQDAPWSAPANLGAPVNSAYLDVAPSLSSDGLILFFHSIRPTGFGSYDLYYSRRPAPDAPWSEPVNLGQTVNSSYVELGPSVSADGRMLYFCEHPDHTPRPGGFGSTDLWQVEIKPVVDCTGDGLVDLEDFSTVALYWRQNEPSVDLGPTPLGDGVVDGHDVAVLADHWLQETGLVAHWKLDEAEGGIAHDRIGGNDGYGPLDLVWRPEDGMVGGALELDGVDDSLFTTFSLNPAETSFSAFAWIRGGGPGQVILSQAGGANWIYVGPSGAKLTTDLKGAGRFGGPLKSETVITDDEWHHVGLSWDGSSRTLYADHFEVAKDTQTTLVGSEGAVRIGTGSAPVPGTFWTGLIDDVRIYNQAMSAEEIGDLAR